MTQPIYEKSAATTALPIYVQISEVLIREIASGQLIDGTRLPPERELAKQHFTTVRTLRKALDILEEKGLIERIHGSGNYVRSGAAVDSIYSMFRLELRSGGGLPTAKIISVDDMTKTADLPPFGTSDTATRVRRIRYLNRVPIALEEIWLDGSAGKIDPAKLSDSLYRYYKMQLGFWISRAEDYVGVGTVPDWAPLDFPLPAETHTGFIERFSHSDQIGTVEFSRTWFDHTTARYVQRLK
ncbi:GntR family transcriptional regulator [Marivivens niveibacter]|uniref:GntR family transcriptional regulator n=1 Tax=Marivivens niveibacter TaxID=1930667 RepID=A0A251WW13_9RHOB|nr:GntR family transcriptional regulator [Marivivens niveibacter]OUD08451.1 GntR family transcriptional regulator [Marivivens niveibacter]